MEKAFLGNLYWKSVVFFKTFSHFFQNCTFYKRSFVFLKSDFLRLFHRFFYNPYSQNLLYGITPLKTFDAILTQFSIPKNGQFLELGSGNGRLCQFAQIFYQVNAIGVEKNLKHFLFSKSSVKQAQFINDDFLQIDLSHIDFVYLFATGIDEALLEKLSGKLAFLKKGACVAIVSNKLVTKDFYLYKQLLLPFVFGKANVYCYMRI